MRTTIHYWAIAAAAVVLALVAFVPASLAQTPNPGNGNGNGNGNGSPGSMMGGGGMMRGGGMMGGGMMNDQSSLLAVAADKLDMTTAELLTALGTTRSIAQVAGEHNVALSVIMDAFIAPRQDHMADMVTSGHITQAQADQMLATMRENVNTRLNEVWAAGGAGQGTGFNDEDGDGVCDHAGMMGGRGGR